MKKLPMTLAGILAAILAVTVLIGPGEGANPPDPKSNSTARPSNPPTSSGGSSSKPSSGKSFGSGSSPPSTSKTDKGFGSGSSTTKDKDKNSSGKGFGSGSAPPAGKDKGFGSGTPHPSGKDKGFGSGSSTGSAGTKPKGTFDVPGGTAAQRAESKKSYERGKSPATEYKTAKGDTIKIDPKDRKIAQLRNDLSEEKWRNRELRQQHFYSSYYSRPVVVYHDPYPSFFWWWMLDRSIEQQALWAYHHRASMDPVRYNDLLAKNAELSARVKALETQKVVPDPSFKPAGMEDRDMMYDDNYVNAVVNPQQRPAPPYQGPAVGKVMLYVLGAILGLLLIWFIVWLIFVKKWGSS
jgi:hypothetical protein